jgi:hypothetical protein
MLETDEQVSAYRPLNQKDQSSTKIFFDSRQFGTHTRVESQQIKPNQSYQGELVKDRKRGNSLSIKSLERKTDLVLTSKFYDNSVAKYLNK